jgi:hypothetical protein
MIAVRIAPFTEIPVPAAVAAIPGHWPGPAANDFLDLAQTVVAW